MPAEVEAKFVADGDAALDALAQVPSLGRATLGPGRSVDELDRYLDTADGRLDAALWACRLRRRDGVTRVSLKGPAATTDVDWHHSRPEVEGPATDRPDPAAWPDSEARARLLEMSRGAPLVERFALAQRRTERPVLIDGARAGTLSLDSITVLEGEKAHGALQIVELELTHAESLSDSDFAELAAALSRVPGLRPDPLTKLEHALLILDARQ